MTLSLKPDTSTSDPQNPTCRKSPFQTHPKLRGLEGMATSQQKPRAQALIAALQLVIVGVPTLLPYAAQSLTTNKSKDVSGVLNAINI